MAVGGACGGNPTRPTLTSAPAPPPAAPAPASYRISGTYTLTIHANSPCSGLPLELRTRTYTATISQENSSWLNVSLSNDAETCHAVEGNSHCGFFGRLVNDSVEFGLFNDGIGGPEGTVLEALGSRTLDSHAVLSLFTAQGSATGRVTDSVITTSFRGQLSVEDGSLSDWLFKRGATCAADDHQFTFVRQSETEISGVQE
jgi:hypothetical protein